jgi:hypothetical protein
MGKRLKLISSKCKDCSYKNRCLKEMESDWDMQCPKQRYIQEERSKETIARMLDTGKLSGLHDTSNGPSLNIFDSLFWDYLIVAFREWKKKIWDILRGIYELKRFKYRRRKWLRHGRRTTLKAYWRKNRVGFLIDLYLVGGIVALAIALLVGL